MNRAAGSTSGLTFSTVVGVLHQPHLFAGEEHTAKAGQRRKKS